MSEQNPQPEHPARAPKRAASRHSARLQGWERPLASIRRILSYPALLPGAADFLLRNFPVPSARASFGPKTIDRMAFGINIAPGQDEEADDYLVARLRELGVGCVRIDIGYSPRNQKNVERLVRRLAGDGFRILLHLVPPRREALRSNRRDALARWEKFVQRTIGTFRDLTEAFEVGSTPNRYGWAGFTVTSYARWVAAGMRLCRNAGIPCYGPNVTDFSPLYNAGLLWLLKRHGIRPDVHTNNLFVDRALEPERRDPKVLSRASSRLHMNLPDKAALLAAVSRHFDIPSTCCTYTYWTLNVKSRTKARYVSEEQYADYLVRYLVLALTCGALDRVYWGQMISFAKGLIDDGSGFSPDTPTVHHQWRLRGQLEDYRIRPAFHAYANLTRLLGEGVRFHRRVLTPPNVFLMEFQDAGGELFLIGWTVDGLSYDASMLLPEKSSPRTSTIYGEAVAGDGLRLCSSPRIIRCEAGTEILETASEDWEALSGIHPPAGDEPWVIVDTAAAKGYFQESRRRIFDQIAADRPLDDPEIRHTVFSGKRARETVRRIFTGAAALQRNELEVAPLLGIVETSGHHVHLVWQNRSSEHPLPKWLMALDPDNRQERDRAAPVLAQAEELIRRMHRRGMLHGAPDAEAFLVRETGDAEPEVILSPSRLARVHVTRRVALLRRLNDLIRFDPGPGWRLLSIRLRLRRRRERRSAERIRRRGLSS